MSTPVSEKARLVEQHLPLVESIARTYRTTAHVEHRELIQEGVVGLLRAIERYDPSRGVPFGAYAAWWVRQAMQQLVAELTRPVVLSDRALRHVSRLRDAHREALAESGREPSVEELGRRSGLTEDQIADLLAVEGHPRSLDEPVVGEDGRVGTFGDLIADPLAEGEYERVLSAIETQRVLELLSELSERERSVLSARSGLDGDARSLRDLAGEMGVSPERVRQIESRALGKLAAAAPRDAR